MYLLAIKLIFIWILYKDVYMITDQDLMYFLAIKFGSRITISELSFSLQPGEAEHERKNIRNCQKEEVKTCSEVDDNITEEDGVGDNVEDDPAGGEVVVEEGDGDGEDDQVGDEEEQHADVPVEPEL